MNKKSIFWGLALILVAVYMIVSRLGVFPYVPLFQLLFTVLFAILIVEGIMKFNFFEILIPAAFLICIYDKPLHLESITPWPVLIAALLCSIGLSMIFKPIRDRKKNKAVFMHGQIDNSNDGSYVQLNNTFGGISKYVNTNYFAKADLKNAFGQCNVYFNNAVMANGKAEITISNSFGEMNLYFPNTWRVHVERKAAFGEVNMHGMGNSDMDAPFVEIHADSSFGEVNIFFE